RRAGALVPVPAVDEKFVGGGVARAKERIEADGAADADVVHRCQRLERTADRWSEVDGAGIVCEIGDVGVAGQMPGRVPLKYHIGCAAGIGDSSTGQRRM